ncbi:amidohydrolase family protein [Candidatus Uabimicrobium amorphum]|uniref:Amidohydrolase n=1 Tax=Uabimicrobium amorphum TaxID=2596890 RepID=A0A5S9F1E0_UABAM|nr:amidohydrolase family protein [Candidatus Uabimicrobium amorphum]BBM82565.1 amidohydrolase [Candidatus Uabimicrobium amorphum]
MRKSICLIFALLISLNAQIAVKGEVIHTMAGEQITNGVILIRDGKIAAIGTTKEVIIPKECQVLSAKVVTPGLIDARSVVGLGGMLNQSQDQDQLERSAPMQPELRAIDAYNSLDPLVKWIRQLGVTTVNTGHAPGMLMSGQTMVVKTHGTVVDKAVMKTTQMIAVTLGDSGLMPKGSPGTRGKAVAMLRGEFVRIQNQINAREQAQAASKEDEKNVAKSTQPRNIRDEILERVLNREVPLLVYAHRHYDILSALRLAKEFNIEIVLDGASEAYLLVNEIKEAGVSVIVHPSMSRTFGEKQNMSMENASILQKAGIRIAMQSGYESYVPKTRVVLFEAAIAAAYGLGFDNALKAITIDAAKILGIDARVGSLEVGKDADIALYDGDPFEYTSHCTAVIIDGKIVSSESH